MPDANTPTEDLEWMRQQLRRAAEQAEGVDLLLDVIREYRQVVALLHRVDTDAAPKTRSPGAGATKLDSLLRGDT